MLVILLLTGCDQQIPFDPKKWEEKGDIKQYLYRNSMINDLVQNHKLKGLSKTEWTTLLGSPDNADSLTVVYSVFIHYDVIDPDQTKDLLLELNTDSSIKSFRVNEWKKHSKE